MCIWRITDPAICTQETGPPWGVRQFFMSLPHFSSDFTIKMSHLSRSFTIKHGDFRIFRRSDCPTAQNPLAPQDSDISAMESTHRAQRLEFIRT